MQDQPGKCVNSGMWYIQVEVSRAREAGTSLGDSVVKTPCFQSVQETWLKILGGELRSHMLQGMAKKEREKQVTL